jgi:purine-cytosine permease-like protein
MNGKPARTEVCIMDKYLVLPGGILWIAGLVMSIVGMNLHTDTGRLVAIIGNIVFLVGLGIFGAAWLMARKSKDSEKQED